MFSYSYIIYIFIWYIIYILLFIRSLIYTLRAYLLKKYMCVCVHAHILKISQTLHPHLVVATLHHSSYTPKRLVFLTFI